MYYNLIPWILENNYHDYTLGVSDMNAVIIPTYL